MKLIKMQLHVKISVLFAVLMLVISVILIYTSYLHLTRVIKHVNAIVFDRILDDTAACLETDFRKISSELEILAETIVTEPERNEDFAQKLTLLRVSLDNNPSVNAVYVGYTNGGLLLLRRLDSFAGYEDYWPPANAYYAATIVGEGGENSRAELIFYDRAFKELKRAYNNRYGYDARTRIWFKEANASDEVIITPPYIFFSTKAIGITMACADEVTGNVVGFDYTMDSLLAMINRYSQSMDTRTILINNNGQVLTSNYQHKAIFKKNDSYEIVTVDNIVDPVINDYAKSENTKGADVEFVSAGELWRGKKKEFSLQDEGQNSYTVLTVTPESTLMLKASEYKHELIFAGILIILVILPVVWLVAVLIARPLIYLSEQLNKIKNFDFKSSINTESSVVEIDNLIKSSQTMISTIKKFQTIAETITKQKEYDVLLNTILSESTAIVNGKGAAVYLFDNLEQELELAALYLAGKGEALQKQVLEKVRANGVIAKEAFEKYLGKDTDFYYEKPGETLFDKEVLLWPGLLAETELSLATVLLKDTDGHMMGYIIFAHEEKDYQTEGYKSELAFIKALSGFVSAAIEGQLLIKKREELLQSLIMLIADAIDAKSPYTGKHCHRVPIITKMLVQEACDSQAEAYAEYNLNADEWEEIRIASWLHDCGKVITPVDIVDKATKLECIYNRIHEIRMRFELLKSYADTEYWQGVYEGGDVEVLGCKREERKRELDEEFEFVAGCNVGGEFMSEPQLERLQEIGSRTWLRTLDNTLGLSEIELKQYWELAEKSELPVVERLLADKPEQVVPKLVRDFEADNPWGFTMQEPENASNHGELYNLSIRKGTLSCENRYIINAHMVHTIKMLSALPFPKHMQNIVEIAGSHHEQIVGGGYPRGIPAKELPLAARAIAIADIFEALTSSDRPYKKTKTLSQALKIMKYMVADGHIDKGLFELFITSGRAEEYARKYLLEEQQDAINIAELLD